MNSLPNYLAVLALLLLAVFIRKPPLKQSVLLAASYIFYATWGATFLLILVFSSVVNFALGAFLRRKPTAGRLWLGIIFNLSLLSLFKYVSPVFPPGTSPSWLLVMPVGMSFWTFQALSYLFDTYQEEGTDPTLTEFCLYLAFWPTVLMGPVCRLPKLLPQFRSVLGLSSSDLVFGLRRIASGLFMKLVFAQLLASGLNMRSDGVGVAGGLDAWFLAIGYGLQLFFDFAGYSNIVIGAARLFGYRLEENFDSPYLATTPSAFWTRWHMSLSSWIRDYVFIPVAGIRRGTAWRYFALLLSMVLFGLWHGATSTFLLWGLYHGSLLVLHRVGQQLQRRFNFSLSGGVWEAVSWAVTFLGISLGWILFSARDLTEAQAMFQAVLSPATYFSFGLPGVYYRLVLVVGIGYLGFVSIARSDWFARVEQRLLSTEKETGETGILLQVMTFFWQKRWWWLTPAFGTLAFFAACVLFQSSTFSPFIYTLF